MENTEIEETNTNPVTPTAQYVYTFHLWISLKKEFNLQFLKRILAIKK